MSFDAPVTLIIIAITCVVSIMAFSRQALLDDLVFWPTMIARKHAYYRFVSYGLVHADGSHLLFNMLTLFFFGRYMEPFFTGLLGPAGFLLFYLGALLVSIVPSWLRHRHDLGYRSLGASGAVSAVLFAFILLAPWARIYVLVIPLPAILYAAAYVVYSIYMDRMGRDRVNHSAHLWGAAYGVLFTCIVQPAVIPHFLATLAQPGF